MRELNGKMFLERGIIKYVSKKRVGINYLRWEDRR